MIVTVKVNVDAVVYPDGNGYSAEVPGMPGCLTCGDTIEEIQANLVEAIEVWLAVHHDRRRDLGPMNELTDAKADPVEAISK